MSNINLETISNQSINENQSTNQSTLNKIIEHPKAKIVAGALGLSLVAAGSTALALTAPAIGAVAAVAAGIVLAVGLLASVANIYLGFSGKKDDDAEVEYFNDFAHRIPIEPEDEDIEGNYEYPNESKVIEENDEYPNESKVMKENYEYPNESKVIGEKK